MTIHFFLTIVFFAEWICLLFFDTIGISDKQQTILFMIDDVKAAQERQSRCIIWVKPSKLAPFYVKHKNSMCKSDVG